jgi:hypothetical protein
MSPSSGNAKSEGRQRASEGRYAGGRAAIHDSVSLSAPAGAGRQGAGRGRRRGGRVSCRSSGATKKPAARRSAAQVLARSLLVNCGVGPWPIGAQEPWHTHPSRTPPGCLSPPSPRTTRIPAPRRTRRGCARRRSGRSAGSCCRGRAGGGRFAVGDRGGRWCGSQTWWGLGGGGGCRPGAGRSGRSGGQPAASLLPPLVPPFPPGHCSHVKVLAQAGEHVLVQDARPPERAAPQPRRAPVAAAADPAARASGLGGAAAGVGVAPAGVAAAHETDFKAAMGPERGGRGGKGQGVGARGGGHLDAGGGARGGWRAAHGAAAARGPGGTARRCGARRARGRRWRRPRRRARPARRHTFGVSLVTGRARDRPQLPMRARTHLSAPPAGAAAGRKVRGQKGLIKHRGARSWPAGAK